MPAHQGKGLIAVAALATAVVMVAASPAVAKPGKKSKIVTRTAVGFATGGPSIATATAACPRKTRALSGGFELPPLTATGAALIFESQMVGQNAWRASAQVLPGSAGTIQLTSFVYCTKGPPALRPVSATVAVPVPADLQVGPAATATCPGKAEARAGGFVTEPPVVGNSAKSAVIDSFRSAANAWQMRIIANTSGATTISAIAYCGTPSKKKGKKPRVRPLIGSEQSLATTPQLAVVTPSARCSGKRSPLAGGFSQPAATTAISGGNYFHLFASRRGANGGWESTGVHVSDTAGSLISNAYCG